MYCPSSLHASRVGKPPIGSLDTIAALGEGGFAEMIIVDLSGAIVEWCPIRPS